MQLVAKMSKNEQILRTFLKICKPMFFKSWFFCCSVERIDYGNLKRKAHKCKIESVGVGRMNFRYGSCDRSYIVQSVTFVNRNFEVVGEKLFLGVKRVF